MYGEKGAKKKVRELWDANIPFIKLFFREYPI
jgi:hypothetical protein